MKQPILKKTNTAIIASVSPKPVIVKVKALELPFDSLSWTDFETLCRYLAATDDPSKMVRPYGVKGNKQDGIDFFSIHTGEYYIAYQCKNVKKFGPAKIKDAVEEFLKENWADKAKVFVLCTALALGTKLQNDEIIKQRKILNTKGIEFKVWDATELNRLLTKHPQLVMDFFGEQVCRLFIGDERMHEVIVPKPLPPKITFSTPRPYIRRTVNSDKDDVFWDFGGDGKTLLEVLEKNQHISLLAWGQDGKSTELAWVASQLGKPESPWFPLLYKMNMYGFSDIETLFGAFPDIPEEKAVILLDGLDEVLNSHFDLTAKKILQFAVKYPKAKIIVSCRTNFYSTDHTVSGASTLVGFKSYSLNPISQGEIEKYVTAQLGQESGAFWKEVRSKSIESQLTKPSYLVRIIEQYAQHKKIVSGKAALYNEEVTELISLDVRRSYVDDVEQRRSKCFAILAKLAFLMISTNQNAFDEQLIKSTFPSDSDRKLLKNLASLVILDDVDKHVRFVSAAFQEYFASTALSICTLKQLKKIMVSNTNGKKVSRIWVNTLLFLTSSLTDKDDQKSKLFDWLRKDNLEILVQLQVQDMSETKRFEYFRTVINRLRFEDRRLMVDGYNPVELATFSQGQLTLNYLLESLKANPIQSLQENILELLPNYQFSVFPAIIAPMKQEVMKIVMTGLPSSVSLGLIFINSVSKLNIEDFRIIFQKHHQSMNTWIRYILFRTIHLNNFEEEFLDYVLENSYLLIKEQWQERKEKEKRDRLSNEFNELETCISNIVSAEGLSEIFKFLAVENRFLNFCHDPAFRRAIESVLHKISDYPDAVQLQKAVEEVFTTQYTYILSEDKLSAEFMRFFENAGLQDGLFKKFYKSVSASHGSVMNAMSYLGGKAQIVFLFEEYEANSITNDDLTSYEYYFGKNKPELLPFFRKCFQLPTPLEKLAVDFKEQQIAVNSRSLKALFDKNQFVNELKLIFDDLGQDELSYDDTYSNDYYSNKYLTIARDFLDIYQYRRRHISDVLNMVELVWKNGFITRICDFLIANKDAVLETYQIEILCEWCQSEIGSINFRTAITFDSYNSWYLDKKAIELSYLMRKLALDQFDLEVYLDLLSFVRHNDNEIDIFDYVTERVGSELLTSRVFENLREQISYPQVIQNYLSYIVNRKISEAGPLLIPYLLDDGMGMKSEILDAYLKLSSELAPLEMVLERADSYFLESAIIAMRKVNAPFLIKILIKKFEIAEQEFKLSLSKHLIRLQYLPALDYYCDQVYIKGIVPDYSSPDNPLYSLRHTGAIGTVLKLAEFSANNSYKHEKMKDLLTIAVNTLKSIALNETNFGKVNRIMALYFLKMRLKLAFSKNIALNELVKNLKENWRITENYFHQERESYPDFNEALVIYNSIDG